MPPYKVIVDPKAKGAIKFRGANRQLFGTKDHETILAGPASTGKTVACCAKVHLFCLRYENVQGAMVRKTFASLSGSCLQTFFRLTNKSPYTVLGGDSPKKIIYPNGSTIWLGGMDKPERVLSSERDFIYINQCEELKLNDWEILGSRCTGRSGVTAYPQLFGDCNPSASMHWIRQRAKAGNLKLLNSTHKDNPSLYDDEGNLTERGKQEMDRLDKLLTGVRRKRLLEGIWATAEGAVYDMFDPTVHVCTRFENEMVHWYLAMDEGYTNPQTNLLVGADTDGRWHVFREFYVTGKLESEIVSQAKGWYLEKKCELAACDEAAAGLIAALNNAGVHTIGGKGRILDGIFKIQDRLKIPKDGRPRLTVDPSCVNTINEFESYAWKPEKDVPVDAFNHAIGGLRYLSDVLNEPTGAFKSTEGIRVGQTSPKIIEPDILTPDDLDLNVQW